MNRSKWIRAIAVFFSLALALTVIGLPGNALASVTALSFNPASPQSILVGQTLSITATPTQTGTTTTYTWTNNSSSIFSLSSTSGNPVTVTGLTAGTGTITVNAKDEQDLAGSLPGTTETYTITVTPMTISAAASIIGPGSTTTVTATNFTGSITSWTSSNTSVATVASSGAATALVTGIGSGTTTITAYNTPSNGAPVQTATTTITVPTVTLSPASQTLTAASTATTLTLNVTNGGTVIPDTSTVNWSTSDGSIGSLSAATSTVSGGVATIGFTSSSGGINGTTTITAVVGGFTRTATVTVTTARYLDIVGPSDLNKTTRTGTYTVYLKNPDGTVYDDDTSTVHWSWSSSYLSLTSDDINDRRSDMHNGEAHIQLYAKYNTPSGGTRLYAWVNSDTGNKVYHTINITGLSSLPQTGQDMTLVYVFGGLSAALLAAAGVWYGIRKKKTVA